jgi:hypothetical protein
VSDGRTYWWAKDAAWYERERVADLALTFGPIGPAALDWLCCHAKALNDGGRVKSGYSAVAKAIGARRPKVRQVILYAVEIGALDEFEESDERRFTARISGWSSDQERALHALRQARYRGRSAVTARDGAVTGSDAG